MGRGEVDLRIFEDGRALAEAAAEEFFRRAREACRLRNRFACVLSGGSTPRALFDLLAGVRSRSRVPQDLWPSIHLFWGDERAVPPDHPESNYRLAREHLIEHVPVPESNIHRIAAELGPDRAADEYDREIRDFFQLGPGNLPVFDLVYLGLGSDGHTASLFPGTMLLRESRRLAAAAWIPKLAAHRITMTLPAINHSSCVAFLVAGNGKAGIVHRILQSPAPENQDELPALMIRPDDGELLWLVDRGAASLLAESTL